MKLLRTGVAFLILLSCTSPACSAADLQPSDTLFLELKGTYPLEAMGTDVSISALSSGDVLVADGSRSRIWKIHPASGSVQAFAAGLLGSRFIYPQAICEDGDASIWLASPHTREVIQLFQNGTLAQSLSAAGSGLGKPIQVACTEQAGVFILDGDKKTVIQFHPDRPEAVSILLRGIPQGVSPRKLDVAENGKGIFLLDPDGRRLYRLGANGQASGIPLEASTDSPYGRLEAFASGPYDLLYMTDSRSHTILAYTTGGKLRQRFFLIEHLLNHPTGMAVSGKDLWVVDEGRKVVLCFAVETASSGMDHALLGEEDLAVGFAREAVEQFEAASRMGYESGEMQLHWGQALHALSDYKGALERFRKAEVMGPAEADVYLWMGHARSALGMTGDALNDYRKAATMAPGDASAHYHLGMTCLTLGRFQEAEAHLADSARLAPGDPMTRLGLGRLYLARKQYDEARKIFGSFTGRDNPSRQARYYLGLLYLNEGKAREALPYLDRASREGPFFSDSFLAMGNAYRAVGDRGRAEQCYRKALEINANHVEASRALQEMKLP